MTDRPLRFDTLKVRGGYDPAEHGGSVQVPIYQTAAFDLGDPERVERLLGFEERGFTYSRMGNPTVAALEARMAALDGATGAVAVASGRAAVSNALLNVTEGGGRLLTTRHLYGGTAEALRRIFPGFGVQVDHAAEVDDAGSFARAVRPDTRAIFVESLSNPHADVADVAGIAAVAHAHGLPLIVDNTFATPYLLRPIEHGADVVVHSATKGLSGSGSTIAGVITESGRFDWANGRFPQFTEPLHLLRGRGGAERGFVDVAPAVPFTLRIRLTHLACLGGVLGPHDAYLVLLGLETLSERVAKQVATTRRIVTHLEQHEHVAWVRHPSATGSPSAALAARYLPRGAGSMLSFGLRGTVEQSLALIRATRVFGYQANVGDARSLIVNPARTTHSELTPAELAAAGIAPETLRLSIGLEDPDDLIADLDQAIASAIG